MACWGPISQKEARQTRRENTYERLGPADITRQAKLQTMSPLGRDESPDQLLSGSGEVATRSLVQQKFLLLEIVADVQVAKEARGLDHNVQVELVTAHANNGLTDPSAITLREASEGEEQTYRKATSGMTVAAHVASERRRVVGATINDGGAGRVVTGFRPGRTNAGHASH